MKSGRSRRFRCEAYQAMVGKEIGVSSWHLVDQTRINVYADVIEDHQFIHVDPERAKSETAFGTTVAHGFLTMSLMSHHVLRGDAGHRRHHDGRQLRLRQAALHLAGALGLARARPLSRWRKRSCASRRNCSRAPTSRVEIEGEEKPALVADWIGLIYFA